MLEHTLKFIHIHIQNLEHSEVQQLFTLAKKTERKEKKTTNRNNTANNEKTMNIVWSATLDLIENSILSLVHREGESQYSCQVIEDDTCVGQASHGL